MRERGRGRERERERQGEGGRGRENERARERERGEREGEGGREKRREKKRKSGRVSERQRVRRVRASKREIKTDRKTERQRERKVTWSRLRLHRRTPRRRLSSPLTRFPAPARPRPRPRPAFQAAPPPRAPRRGDVVAVVVEGALPGGEGRMSHGRTRKDHRLARLGQPEVYSGPTRIAQSFFRAGSNSLRIFAGRLG